MEIEVKKDSVKIENYKKEDLKRHIDEHNEALAILQKIQAEIQSMGAGLEKRDPKLADMLIKVSAQLFMSDMLENSQKASALEVHFIKLVKAAEKGHINIEGMHYSVSERDGDFSVINIWVGDSSTVFLDFSNRKEDKQRA